jgi:sorbitol-6-phosphate 2-dehydrogenase
LLAKELKGKGCKVVVFDVNPPPADTDILFIKCDVTSYDQVKKGIDEVHSSFGPINILVNNAGVVSAKSILDLEERDILRYFYNHFYAKNIQCEYYFSLLDGEMRFTTDD